jgi:hypothetical protein
MVPGWSSANAVGFWFPPREGFGTPAAIAGADNLKRQTEFIMKTNWLKLASLVSIGFVALSACGAGDIGSDEGDFASDESDFASEESEMSFDEGSAETMSLGSIEQHLMSCANPDGANAAMAALVVAVAQDLGRWQTGKDFVQGNNAGEIVTLASGSDADGPKGKSRCADGKCARVQAILDMQLDAAANKVYFQGTGSTKVLLNPQALRSRMLSKWREQVSYDGRSKDGDATVPPLEKHKLAFVSAAKGGCDTNFTFKATTPTGTALKYPGQLKWKVAFGDINNPYISFTNLGNGNVSVDPTYGLNEDSSSSAGTCTAACTKITTTNVAGQCCSCGGLTKKYAKSAWNASTFLCQ